MSQAFELGSSDQLLLCVLVPHVCDDFPAIILWFQDEKIRTRSVHTLTFDHGVNRADHNRQRCILRHKKVVDRMGNISLVRGDEFKKLPRSLKSLRDRCALRDPERVISVKLDQTLSVVGCGRLVETIINGVQA